MDIVLMLLIQQIKLEEKVQKDHVTKERGVITLQLKNGATATLQADIIVDSRGKLSIVNIPYKPEDIKSISVKLSRRNGQDGQPPRLMAWTEGSVPVDTTLDEWKDTTIDVSGTPVTITKMLGIANIGTYDIYGKLNVGSSFNGVMGFTVGNNYSGVLGLAAADSAEGVRGEVLSGYSNASAVTGLATGGASVAQSNTAIHGEAQGSSTEYSSGVVGIRISGTTYSVYVNNGVYGYSDVGTGVVGFRSSGGTAISGGVGSLYTVAGSGVVGYSGEVDGYGVVGLADGASSSTSGHIAVLGYDMNSTDSSYAVFAYGDFAATGGKSFIIDHPLDPANKFLKHYSIESNEILNVYRGTARLDANGEAVVYLPDYFEAINAEFSYQLTPVGAPMPDLYIKEEVSGNRFVIAGGKPGMKVSWTVYARRNDAYVRNHRNKFRDVIEKPASMRGKYLYPEFYGRSKDATIIQPVKEEAKIIRKK